MVVSVDDDSASIIVYLILSNGEYVLADPENDCFIDNNPAENDNVTYSTDDAYHTDTGDNNVYTNGSKKYHLSFADGCHAPNVSNIHHADVSD